VPTTKEEQPELCASDLQKQDESQPYGEGEDDNSFENDSFRNNSGNEGSDLESNLKHPRQPIDANFQELRALEDGSFDNEEIPHQD